MSDQFKVKMLKNTFLLGTPCSVLTTEPTSGFSKVFGTNSVSLWAFCAPTLQCSDVASAVVRTFAQVAMARRPVL